MKKTIAIIALSALPILALAQTIQQVLLTFKNIIDIATVVVIALALLVFIWGLMRYIMNGPGEEKNNGRDLMIYGIIALFVMVSVWGLVRVLSNTFGVTTGGGTAIPGVGATIPGVSGGGSTINVGIQGSFPL